MMNEQIKSEIRFLKSEHMIWLVHEADIGSCHANYLPIDKRIRRLQNRLKKSEKVNFRRSTGKFCWTGKSPGKRKVHDRPRK